MKKLLLVFLLALASGSSFSQRDTCSLQISLLTCAPGEELYSTFGHSAMRVRDSVSGMDIIYNYGTFEFSPEFYTQFIRGKLLYYLSVQSFMDFVEDYRWQKRSIQEQVLLLTCEEKQKLFEALQHNSLDSNKFYRYDFLVDNCSTRLRDILSKATKEPVGFGNILGSPRPTYRDLIHTYLDRGGQYWSKLGIDMLLGAKLDNRSDNRGAMFLPDYLLKGYEKAGVSGRPLASAPTTILNIESPLNKGSWFRPTVIFSLLLLIMIALSFMRSSSARTILHALDKFVFVLAGVAGIIMMFMWFATDHEVCSNNYNLIWAMPTHALAAWFMHRRTNLISRYFSIIFLMLFLFLLTWNWLPQEINISLLPLVLILFWRSFVFSTFREYAFRKRSEL